MQDPSTAPEREWVESSLHVGIGRPDATRLAAEGQGSSLREGRYPAGHPLAWLNEESEPSISEERRQEIIRLGFPDDGYDYLQHMRQGHATSDPQPSINPDSSNQQSSHGMFCLSSRAVLKCCAQMQRAGRICQTRGCLVRAAHQAQEEHVLVSKYLCG